MKQIIDFLLRKEVIMVVSLLVIGLLIGKKCSDDKVDEHEKSYLEYVADSLKAEASKIQNRLDERDKKIAELEVINKEKDKRLEENDSIYNRSYNYYNREIRRLRALAPEEATGIIDSIYSGIPEEERDRAILIDLKRGEQSDSLLNIASQRIDFLESKIVTMSEIMLNKDGIIEDLKMQNEIHKQEARVANDRASIAEKQLRKEKIWKWVGFGVGAAGIIFGVTR